MDSYLLAGYRMGFSLPYWNGARFVEEQMACAFTGTHRTRIVAHFRSCNRRVARLQSTGIVLTIGGYFLGHMHGGRKFLGSAHETFANIVMAFVAVQLALGIYLKLHVHERSIRPYAVVLHGIVGKTYPIIGWTQMLFGAIAYMGYCRGGHLGQCLAHYIMVRRVSVVLIFLSYAKLFISQGSGFIAYAILMSILLLVGEGWIRRKGKSPEFYDSLVITLWVCSTEIK